MDDIKNGEMGIFSSVAFMQSLSNHASRIDFNATDSGNADTLLIDCENGARKSALVNSLLGMLDDPSAEAFLERFRKIGIDGVDAVINQNRLDGKSFRNLVIMQDGKTERELIGQNAHEHRTCADVSYIIDTLAIDGQVARNAIGVYEILARAEAQAHDTNPQSVHFHEVGNNFAIASIVAFSMLVDMIKPGRIVATGITTGFGFVECAHGRVALPAPATANIIASMPSRVGNMEGELVTPTGAALISHFVEDFVDMEKAEALFGDCVDFCAGFGIDIERFGTIVSIAKIQE